MVAHALRTASPAARKASKPIARRAARTIPDAAPRADIYEEVTAKIVAELEAGRLPWVQPWQSAKIAPTLPHNAATGRRYNGVNVLLLWSAAMSAGYPTMGFMTFQQARDLGACVRKGEKASMIVYADRFVPAGEKARAERDGDAAKAVPFLKRHCVFNIAQIDDLPDRFKVEPEPISERETIDAAEAVMSASGVPIRIGGDKAFYMPAVDAIQVPEQTQYFEPINWYRTVLHELTHATGHHSRLDRKLMTMEGKKDYAFEELIAEMGSAFLCASLGIVPTVRHSDYIASWLEVLKNDKKFIFKAASQATKAADFLLSKVEG